MVFKEKHWKHTERTQELLCSQWNIFKLSDKKEKKANITFFE